MAPDPKKASGAKVDDGDAFAGQMRDQLPTTKESAVRPEHEETDPQ